MFEPPFRIDSDLSRFRHYAKAAFVKLSADDPTLTGTSKMEVELIEIRQFLEQRNPFNYLEQELLDELPKDIEIRYLRRGGKFPPKEGFLYIVRSGAIEIFDKQGELCEKLGEGDVYSVTCQLVNLSQCDRGEASRGHPAVHAQLRPAQGAVPRVEVIRRAFLGHRQRTAEGRGDDDAGIGRPHGRRNDGVGRQPDSQGTRSPLTRA